MGSEHFQVSFLVRIFSDELHLLPAAYLRIVYTRTRCDSKFFPERKNSAAGEKVRGPQFFTDKKDRHKEFSPANPRQKILRGKNPGLVEVINRDSWGVLAGTG